MASNGTDERIMALESQLENLTSERNTWRALLIEVVGDVVAERMFEATR